MYEVGKKYLITTNNWFFAPDGQQYRAVWGTVKDIKEDSEMGIKTNRHSTNWFVEIGSMVVAGCQIYYAVQCNECNTDSALQHDWGDGKGTKYLRGSAIYDADLEEC